MVTADLLVRSAQCTIGQIPTSCSYLNETYGISSSRDLAWLTLLATRRDTYITPTTNCLGFIVNKRTELGVDTNRDFPYGRRDGACLRSVAARTVNSIMKNNVIQVRYSWGQGRHTLSIADCACVCVCV